jgi:signal transduction histidine kinase
VTSLSQATYHRLHIGLTGLGGGILIATAIGLATSNRGPFPVSVITVGPFFVTSAYLVAGWVGWKRRPDSRIGLMLLIAGVLYAAENMAPIDWAPLFTISWLTGNFYENVVGHMLLAFPSGRLRNQGERLLVIAFYATGVAGSVIAQMFENPKSVAAILPRNLALITSAPHVGDAINLVTEIAAVPLTAAFVVVMVHHWRDAASTTRRALATVYWAGAVAGGLIVIRNVLDSLGTSFTSSMTWAWLYTVASIAVPIFFLLGLLRLQMTRAALGDLVIELGRDRDVQESLRDALARRLGDPTLQLSYQLPDGSWIDDAGEPIAPPHDVVGRMVRTLESDGARFAALTMDERLREVPEVVDAVAAVAGLAIANDRLRAEVRVQLAEVEASRRRIVGAADDARRKVERDLHDGAQQRLVGLALGLQMLQDHLAHAEDVEGEIQTLQGELRDALTELRELARGLHPTILTEEGLVAAIESLAERSNLPVTLSLPDEDRLPVPIEATAYFVVAEALTNATKYAQASKISVEVSRNNGILAIDVTDDGVGGARTGAGSGLTGLLDRVAALGGSLKVESPVKGGTRVHAELPSI